MKRLLQLVPLLLILLLPGCRPDTDPSPGSPPAEEPPGEALEADHPPDSLETERRYAELMQYARDSRLAEQPIGEIVHELGLQFLGTPYIVGPLDGFGREVLVYRLDGFDCFTYLEAMLAAARGVKTGDYSFDSYVERTREQRYRDGQMRDYCSRLHYYTEWIWDNERKDYVRSITRELGGIRLDKSWSFMTEHRSSYPALESDSVFQCIRDVEDRLNRTLEYYYIPQDRISENYDRLASGDLIATATNIEGLDVTHTGMVHKGEDGSTGLLHASTDGGVKISTDLQEYVQGVRAQIGIIVARPLEPGAKPEESTGGLPLP